jgi:hypothetical protein
MNIDLRLFIAFCVRFGGFFGNSGKLTHVFKMSGGVV